MVRLVALPDQGLYCLLDPSRACLEQRLKGWGMKQGYWYTRRRLYIHIFSYRYLLHHGCSSKTRTPMVDMDRVAQLCPLRKENP